MGVGTACRAAVVASVLLAGAFVRAETVALTTSQNLLATNPNALARFLETAPTLQISEIARFDQVAAASARTMTLLFWSFLALAVVVVLLSLTGIYAVFSFAASQRTREIGIRVALGGRRRHVITALFRRPLMQVRLGILIGLIIADRLSEGEMERIIAVYGCGVIAVSVLATLGPVRRALRIQPLDALRAD